MIPDNVTLIVKAPNQQIEDQNIECASTWTVKELKGHLTEVYPSKPSTDEQKIIYSGQLLDDNSVLKDVLRNYDTTSDRIAHTMHLVCTPKGRNRNQLPETASAGLRQRNVQAEQPRPEVPRPETRQNDQNHTVEMQNYLSSFVNNYGRVPPYPNYNFGEGYNPAVNDPAMFANQMMMVQQAYMQYMQQYANMRQAMTERPAAEVQEANAPPQEAVEVRPPQEEGVPQRDWLDHMYGACRLAILFSLVCLYGSPIRLLMVLLLASVAYLHQVGFFRDVNVPQNEEANTNTTTEVQEPTANRNNWLTSIWIIASSFFTSLIPDTN